MKAVDLPWTAMAQESAGARKAALVLHGLAAEERQSILSSLAGPQRDAVEPLLAELEVLGLPRDRGLIDELLAASGTQNRPADPEVCSLAQASAADLAQILAEEPAGLVALLLDCGDWPWRGPFLAALPTPRQRQVEEAQQQLASANRDRRSRPEALETELLELLRCRLAQMPVDRSRPPAKAAIAVRLRRALRWSVS